MFGYIIVNKQEMKFKEFDLYKSYYCGFCQELRRRYGKSGQLTLSYDLTFLILLLTSLYEPETAEEHCRCIAHPFEKHPTRVNEFTGYAADMNLLLSYYKCEDDWHDEHKVTRKVFSDVLKRKVRRIREKYPKKAELVQDRLNRMNARRQTAIMWMRLPDFSGRLWRRSSLPVRMNGRRSFEESDSSWGSLSIWLMPMRM